MQFHKGPASGFPFCGNAHSTSSAKYPEYPLFWKNGLIDLEGHWKVLKLPYLWFDQWRLQLSRHVSENLWQILWFSLGWLHQDNGKKKKPTLSKKENQHLSEAPQSEALHLEAYDGTGCTSKVQNMLNTHSAAMQSKQPKCSHVGNNFIPSTVLTFLWTVYYKDSLLYMIASDRMACDKKPHNTHRLEKTDFVSILIYFACVW